MMVLFLFLLVWSYLALLFLLAVLETEPDEAEEVENRVSGQSWFYRGSYYVAMYLYFWVMWAYFVFLKILEIAQDCNKDQS